MSIISLVVASDLVNTPIGTYRKGKLCTYMHAGKCCSLSGDGVMSCTGKGSLCLSWTLSLLCKLKTF